MNIKTCYICGRAGKDVAEHTSTIDRKVIPYCLDCLWSGREPYDELVNYGWEFDMFAKSYQQRIIIPTLAFNKKSIAQFDEDVRKRLAENDSDT